MDKTARNIIIVLTVVNLIFLGVFGAGTIYLIKVHAQLAEIQARLHLRGAQAHMPPQWFSTENAAPNSVEGKLRVEGKRWVPIDGEITVGAYVQDKLEGRMGQPKGRGSIGKILSIDEGGAQVDFGRDYVVGIHLPELSLVQIQP